MSKWLGNATTGIGGRHVPMTGTEASRAARAGRIWANEIHTTKDKRRLFLQNVLMSGGVWQAAVADEAAMLALNATASRGCWPLDLCERTDTGTLWICVSNRGALLTDWREITGGGGGYTLPIATASDLGGVKVGTGLAIDAVTGVLSTSGGGAGGACVLIAEATPSGVGTVTFSAIPGTYRHLSVRAYGRITATTTSDYVLLRCNGDSASNYLRQDFLAYDNSLITSGTSGLDHLRAGLFPGSSAPTGRASSFGVEICGYASAVFEKAIFTKGAYSIGNNAADQRIADYAGVWRDTSAITSLEFYLASGNYEAGTIFSLYGYA